jgi:hypothetical protein
MKALNMAAEGHCKFYRGVLSWKEMHGDGGRDRDTNAKSTQQKHRSLLKVLE